MLVLGVKIEQPEVEGWLPHALKFVHLQEVAQLGHGAPWHKALQQIVVGRTVQSDAQQQHLLLCVVQRRALGSASGRRAESDTASVGFDPFCWCI
jgi:hypothetical protein